MQKSAKKDADSANLKPKETDMHVTPLKLVILFLSLTILGAGCHQVDFNYIGKSYPPTDHVDLYFVKADVPPGLSVIGRAIVTAPEGTPGEGVKKGLIKEAKAKGADAILVGPARRVLKGKTTYWNWNYYGGPGWAWGNEWGWGYGDPEWDILGPTTAFGAVHASDPQTVYDYALKMKVIFLKKGNP